MHQLHPLLYTPPDGCCNSVAAVVRRALHIAPGSIFARVPHVAVKARATALPARHLPVRVVEGELQWRPGVVPAGPGLRVGDSLAALVAGAAHALRLPGLVVSKAAQVLARVVQIAVKLAGPAGESSAIFQVEAQDAAAGATALPVWLDRIVSRVRVDSSGAAGGL